jgi:hypothetical protein
MLKISKWEARCHCCNTIIPEGNYNEPNCTNARTGCPGKFKILPGQAIQKVQTARLLQKLCGALTLIGIIGIYWEYLSFTGAQIEVHILNSKITEKITSNISFTHHLTAIALIAIYISIIIWKYNLINIEHGPKNSSQIRLSIKQNS